VNPRSLSPREKYEASTWIYSKTIDLYDSFILAFKLPQSIACSVCYRMKHEGEEFIAKNYIFIIHKLRLDKKLPISAFTFRMIYVSIDLIQLFDLYSYWRKNIDVDLPLFLVIQHQTMSATLFSLRPMKIFQ
jgi:hypothetical protein